LFLNDDIEPRKWQRKALDAWAQNDMHGIAHVVTGGGKTVFSYLCIDHFLKTHPDGQITIVVPTLALLDQWAVDIVDSTNLTEDQVSCFSGQSRPAAPNKVNILVINTARNRSAGLATAEHCMLVVDECHRAATTQNARALEGNYIATLGLSATPHREMDDGFDEYLEPSLGGIIYQYEYRDAHRDKVIVDFDLINVRISPPPANASNITIESERRLTNAVRAAWAVRIAELHRGERIVVFHERVSSLKTIETALAKRGITSVSYHSQLSPGHRHDNLRLFRRGESNVLVTCRALDEGTNVPEANIGIVAQSTSSTRQRIQRLGRVLRPAATKEHASVYTLFYSDDEEEALRAEEEGLVGVARTIWKQGSSR
jgi:superfamily II DNA or RNA helicase